MEDVIGKVRIVMGEGSPHVVALVSPLFHKALELGHDHVIAAVSRIVLPETVMDLLAAIQGQHHVVHLFITEVDNLVVQQHAVGGQGETEVLPVLLLDASGIGHQLLHHLPVHKGLSAEEIHFQISPVSGMLDQKIDGPLPHLKGHKGPVSVILALACKAVAAV